MAFQFICNTSIKAIKNNSNQPQSNTNEIVIRLLCRRLTSTSCSCLESAILAALQYSSPKTSTNNHKWMQKNIRIAPADEQMLCKRWFAISLLMCCAFCLWFFCDELHDTHVQILCGTYLHHQVELVYRIL